MIICFCSFRFTMSLYGLAEDLMIVRDRFGPIEESDRAGFASRFNGENARHEACALPQRRAICKSARGDHTMRLNFSKSGRGERSKMLSGSP